uniref:Transmembrane protein 192 n=1 Tax=Timema californicum TaxID=61474 RepID=A0A7R9PBQ6_TIMCA|nr:unnamed protein product [Timema californicum]
MRFGGVFLNDCSVSGEDDTQQLEPIIGTAESRKFEPLATVAVVGLQLSAAIGVLVLGLVLSFMWPYNDVYKCDPYFIVMYVHATFWCLSLVVHHHVKKKHHLIRVSGYHKFYKKIYNLSVIPFYIVSLWNTALLVVDTLLQHVYSDYKQRCSSTNTLTPVNLLCVIIAVETSLLALFISLYILKVHRFNRKKPSPDVLRDEWISGLIQDSHGSGEIGYRERGSHMQDLLEKQADLISSLSEHNARLSHKIMLLSSQLSQEHLN